MIVKSLDLRVMPKSPINRPESDRFLLSRVSRDADWLEITDRITRLSRERSSSMPREFSRVSISKRAVKLLAGLDAVPQQRCDIPANFRVSFRHEFQNSESFDSG
jgi:hypothetical protein